MKSKLLWVVASLALFGVAPPVGASIIEIDYTGTITGGTFITPNPGGVPPYAFHLFSEEPEPFAATYVFDTDKAALILPGAMFGGLVSATLALPDFPSNGRSFLSDTVFVLPSPSNPAGLSNLEWDADGNVLGPVLINAQP